MVFGKGLKKKFFKTEQLIRDFRLPEKIEVELYQLHYLIHGSWPDWGDTIYSFCHFPQSEAKVISIVGNMAALGLQIPKAYQSSFLIRNGQPKDLSQVITNTIKNRQITNEFIIAWGEYNFNSAVIISVIADDNSQDYETTYIKKNLPNLIERYVFAFWMEAHWINGDQTKENARDSLAERIEEVKNSKHGFSDWKIKALENMISEDQSGIKKTYSEISKITILEMVTAALNLKQDIEIK